MKHIPRIYTDQKLLHGVVVSVDSDTAHHLVNVMRLTDGDSVKVFNSRYGEWTGNCVLRKKDITIICDKQLREPHDKPGFTVIFSLIAPAKMHIILEKATELGAERFCPIITEYTQNKAFNTAKAATIVRNAAEQCGRLSVPMIDTPVTLKQLLATWPIDTKLIVGDWCDNNDITILNRTSSFLIGPEGGFSDTERELFKKYSFIIVPVQISSNVLRAETAAIAFGTLCTR